MLASRHPKSTIFKKGGLPLVKDFLEMVAENNDAASHFHIWVAGKAIQILNGVRVNTANRREKAIAAALPGSWGCRQRCELSYVQYRAQHICSCPTNCSSHSTHNLSALGSVAKNVHTIRVELRDLISKIPSHIHITTVF